MVELICLLKRVKCDTITCRLEEKKLLSSVNISLGEPSDIRE